MPEMTKNDGTLYRRLRMEDVIDLERICIRLDRCATVKPGPIDPDIIHVLSERGFDQAPVYDAASRRLWGLVETDYLQSKLEVNQPLDEDDPVVRDEKHEFHVGAFVTIFDLLQTMATRRAVIVFQDSDATEYGHVEFRWGLFTISDLNRHTIRSSIYHLIAQVESGLAKFLEIEVTDPWTWIKHLDDEQ
jgi:CBS domain containing-hemolysin-like protein